MSLTLEEKELISTAVEFYIRSLAYLNDSNETVRKRKLLAEETLNKLFSNEKEKSDQLIVKEYRKFEDMKEVYTVEDVKEMLGIGKTSIYELIRQNKLKCVRIGRKILIPKFSLYEFMNNGGANIC